MVALACLGLFAVPLLRRRLYEAVLRLHQLLAIAIIYAMLQHLHALRTLTWYCIVASGGFLAGSMLMLVMSVIVRDRAFLPGCARAVISRVDNVVCIDITTPTRVTVHSGQYINLWMPGLSLRSWFQSHPFFVVAVHEDRAGSQLRVIVSPRRGWTRHLYQQNLDLDQNASSRSHIVFFTGPHGIPLPVDDYSVVILAASGSGIIAQLPLIQHLIAEYDNGVARTRRVRVVWQLDHLGTSSSPCCFDVSVVFGLSCAP